MKWFGPNWHRWVLVTLVCAALCYIVFFPLLLALVASFQEQSAVAKVLPQPLLETMNQRLMEGLFAALFFSFGAAIGSFLNVVAYRLPLGRSLIFEPSKCPRCNRRIAARDNFPVFGWFMLKGKCRGCGLAISPRYPIVEAIAGSIFLSLYFRQLISGGANLPIKDLSIYQGVVWIVMYLQWELLAIYAYHCAWLVSLLTWTLFAWDGNRIPMRAMVVAVLTLCIPPLALPYLLQLPADYYDGQAHWPMSPLTKTLVTLAVGAGVGIVLALISKALLMRALAGFRPQRPFNQANFVKVVNPLEAESELAEKNLPDVHSGPAESGSILVSSPMRGLANSGNITTESSLAMTAPDNGQLSSVDTSAELAAEPVPATAAGRLSDGADLDTSLGLSMRPSSSLSLENSVFAGLICTGIAVGWQALAVVMLATCAWRVLCWIGRSERVWNTLPFSAWFLIVALGHHFFWRTLIQFW